MSESNSIFIKGGTCQQLEKYRCRDSEGQAGGDNRAVGEWKIIVGVRYPLCGGTASVCREFIRLRPPVLGEDE